MSARIRYFLFPCKSWIWIAVDYREVNQFFRVSANQQLYKDILFQQLPGQVYHAKVDNLWGYHQLKLDKASSRVTAIIIPWRRCLIGFFRANLEFRWHRENIRSEWPIKHQKGFILKEQSFISIKWFMRTMKKLEILDMVLARMVPLFISDTTRWTNEEENFRRKRIWDDRKRAISLQNRQGSSGTSHLQGPEILFASTKTIAGVLMQVQGERESFRFVSHKLSEQEALGNFSPLSYVARIFLRAYWIRFLQW